MRGPARLSRATRAALAALAAACATLGLAPAACSPAAPIPERIVLVVADTLRADHVGAYGGDARTPVLDRLAREGGHVEVALAPYHQTSMSMAALFTGRTPSLDREGGDAPLPWTSETYCGMARFRTRDDAACLPDALDTLAERLGAAGYETIGVVGNPLLFEPYGYAQGFDTWIEVGRMPGGFFRTGSQRAHAESRAGVHVAAAVGEALEGRASDRFFLYVHSLDVHDWLLLGRSYRSAVESFDAWLGAFLEDLDARGLLDGAWVIVTSDHGGLLRERHAVPSRGMHFGNPSYEPVLRVPLITWPDAPATADDEPVRVRDLGRRILARAGAAPRESAARDTTEQYVSERDYRIYRAGRWKSIWPRDGGPPMLFDWRDDPAERHDRAADRPGVLATHRARIEALASDLATPVSGPRKRLVPAELHRLRVLGYVDDGAAAPADPAPDDRRKGLD